MTISTVNPYAVGIVQTATPSFTSNAYTLLATDGGCLLLASNSTTAGTISVPTNASVAFPIGTQISIIQTGAGQLTVSAVTPGTTSVYSTPGTKIRTQYSVATLVKTAADTWYLYGDLTP
jgi:hypothetical protein